MTAVAVPLSHIFCQTSTPYEPYRDGDCRTSTAPPPSPLYPPPTSKIVELPLPPATQKLLVPTPQNEHSLGLSGVLERAQLACGSVHKLWGNISLDAVNRKVYSDVLSTMDIDFVVVIDHSSSMRLSNKLAYVKATIEYFISQLNEAHRFCLVKFNQDVNLVTDGLIQMSPDNKESVLHLLHNDIRPEGSTNISDALFTALGVLKRRHEAEHSRLSCIMLFTDGLANAGLRGKQFMDSIQGMALPQGLIIHTFGYGVDHDSKMLQDISFCSKGGVYHFIETNDSIPATFGECLAGLLSTVSHNIEVKLSGRDGCRLVNFYTKYPISEITPVKEYSISLGSLYSQESRSILFKLSLRKFAEPLVQDLVDVSVSYTNTLTGRDVKLALALSMNRPATVVSAPMPVVRLRSSCSTRYVRACLFSVFSVSACATQPRHLPRNTKGGEKRKGKGGVVPRARTGACRVWCAA
eukprot:TRINITY_DN8414_c0_g1_i5.p1 TRINITY_DN8414_c0_g1~~TRINITY_DN8414_c0_g1_i5.p1  ORF type:complete len:466 (+),score=36.39 TRINITY_DN8414_c0_g1_i5:240-1637(+)